MGFLHINKYMNFELNFQAEIATSKLFLPTKERLFGQRMVSLP